MCSIHLTLHIKKSKTSQQPFEFTTLPDEQPSAFAAVVEQNHHNTDSYITTAKSRGLPLQDASPVCCITIVVHSGTEHCAAL